MAQNESKPPRENTYVTKPHLPPLDEVLPYLEQIWENHRITNQGPLHEQLEGALAEYLGVEHIALCTNGTLALLTAMQALRLTGEVITTPYSFVATANSLLWNNLTPVFVDIEPDSLALDPAKVEAAITPRTSAILPVHVYGYPAKVDELQEIADLHGLRLIYDAAHCFGVEDDGGSLLRHGDLSVLSFHATKVFNTFEGGAIVCRDAAMKQRIDYLKNFGFAREAHVVAGGINAKMNEFQAAVGLAQLPRIDAAIAARQERDQHYREQLSGIRGLRVHHPSSATRHNHTYFPVFISSDYPCSRDAIYFHLREHGIYGRRYFHPLITDFPMYKSSRAGEPDPWPVAHQTAAEVICLPLYPDLDLAIIDRTCELLRSPPANLS